MTEHNAESDLLVTVAVYSATGHPPLTLSLAAALAPPPTLELFDSAADERVTFVIDPDASAIPER